MATYTEGGEGSPTAAVLDDRKLSSFQLRTLGLCALVAILDGNDTQAMGVGARSIAAALHVAPSAMGWAISGTWLGAAAGAILLGGLADSFGRKITLVLATCVFGLFTLLTPLADTVSLLVVFRVLAGIGLGGAAPCFVALASEYSPPRSRGTVVSIIWAAFPFGLLVGGLLAGLLLSYLPWAYVFYVGGGVSLLVAATLQLWLPESLDYLVNRRPGDPRIRTIMDILAPGSALPTRPARRHATKAGVSALFVPGLRQPTLCLWVLLLTCFGTTASMSWLPTILQQNGVSPAAAAVAVSFLGLGALVGMLGAGWLLDRFGPLWALACPVLLGAIVTAAMGIWPGSPAWESVFVALVGALVGAGAAGGIVLATLIYPSVTRSTGAGWALGLGRFGQFLLPAGVAVLMAQQFTAQAIFAILALMPLLGGLAAFMLRRPANATFGDGRPALTLSETSAR